MKNSYGFSLMEILIVLALISILSAFAMPLYSQYVVQSHRYEAEINLNKIAVALEKLFTLQNSYQTTLDKLGFAESFNDTYQYKLITASNNYSVIATPRGKQATKDSLCGVLSINSNGLKQNSGAGKLVECW